MSQNSRVLSAIFYLVIQDRFYYSSDWILFAEWLGVFKRQPPKNSLSLELVEEIFTAMPNKERISMNGIYRLAEICSLVDKHMSSEEQKDFLDFLRTFPTTFLTEELL